jgi:hypothetical protein
MYFFKLLSLLFGKMYVALNLKVTKPAEFAKLCL